MARTFFFLLFLFMAPAQSERSVETLPVCKANSANIPTSWTTIDLEGSPVTFRLPPNAKMEFDREPGSGRCIHGCERWSGDGLDVLVSYGYWGVNSFNDTRWQHACRVPRNGMSIVLMLMEDSKSMLIWPVRDNEPKTITDYFIRKDWTTDASEEDAQRVAASILLK